MDATNKEKRRYVRRHCALAIELRKPGASFPLVNETTDVSPAGCYVRLMSTFPTGAQIDVVLWAGETKLSFPATVKTADVAVGNGIDFTGMTDEQRKQLLTYLDEIKAPEATSDIIFH
jgi:hypothetical protein